MALATRCIRARLSDVLKVGSAMTLARACSYP